MRRLVDRDRITTVPRLAVLAWAIAALSVAGFAVAWILAAVSRDLFDLSATTSPDRFMVAYAVVGAVLASRRSANPIGWLLLGLGLVTACRALAGQYAQYVLAGHSRAASAEWAAWLVHWSLALVFPSGVLLFLLLLFPDGRLLTARWRAVGWVGAGLVVCSVLGTWLDPGAFTLGPGQPSVPNPTGVRGWTWAGIVGNGVSFVLAAVCLLLAGASVVVRYRRSAGEERLQLKWFAYAVVVSLALMFASLPLAIVTQDGGLVFSHQLREQVDLDVLGADLLGVVNHVLAPAHLALWLSDTAYSPDTPGDRASLSTVDIPVTHSYLADLASAAISR